MRTISARIARLTAASALTLTLGATAGAGPALADACSTPTLCPTSITLAGIAPVPEGGIAPVPEADAGATDKYTPASIDTLAAGEDASTDKYTPASIDPVEDASTTKIPGNLAAPIDTLAAGEDASTDGREGTG